VCECTYQNGSFCFGVTLCLSNSLTLSNSLGHSCLSLSLELSRTLSSSVCVCVNSVVSCSLCSALPKGDARAFRRQSRSDGYHAGLYQRGRLVAVASVVRVHARIIVCVCVCVCVLFVFTIDWLWCVCVCVCVRGGGGDLWVYYCGICFAIRTQWL
jgi:hypothetical protein